MHLHPVDFVFPEAEFEKSKLLLFCSVMSLASFCLFSSFYHFTVVLSRLLHSHLSVLK